MSQFKFKQINKLQKYYELLFNLQENKYNLNNFLIKLKCSLKKIHLFHIQSPNENLIINASFMKYYKNKHSSLFKEFINSKYITYIIQISQVYLCKMEILNIWNKMQTHNNVFYIEPVFKCINKYNNKPNIKGINLFHSMHYTINKNIDEIMKLIYNGDNSNKLIAILYQQKFINQIKNTMNKYTKYIEQLTTIHPFFTFDLWSKRSSQSMYHQYLQIFPDFIDKLNNNKYCSNICFIYNNYYLCTIINDDNCYFISQYNPQYEDEFSDDNNQVKFIHLFIFYSFIH